MVEKRIVKKEEYIIDKEELYLIYNIIKGYITDYDKIDERLLKMKTSIDNLKVF